MDVRVPRRPHVLEELVAFLLRQRSNRVAQLVQRLAQRSRAKPGSIPPCPHCIRSSTASAPPRARSSTRCPPQSRTRTPAETAPETARSSSASPSCPAPAAAAHRPAPSRRACGGGHTTRHPSPHAPVAAGCCLLNPAFKPRRKVLAGVQQSFKRNRPRCRVRYRRTPQSKLQKQSAPGKAASYPRMRPACPSSPPRLPRAYRSAARTRLHWCGASSVNLMPCCAISSSDSESAAVSASHIPSGAEP